MVNTQNANNPVHRTEEISFIGNIQTRLTGLVAAWKYGAIVNYTDPSGAEKKEYFLTPPLLGRFDIATYNEIVRLINLNVEKL